MELDRTGIREAHFPLVCSEFLVLNAVCAPFPPLHATRSGKKRVQGFLYYYTLPKRSTCKE